MLCDVRIHLLGALFDFESRFFFLFSLRFFYCSFLNYCSRSHYTAIAYSTRFHLLRSHTCWFVSLSFLPHAYSFIHFLCLWALSILLQQTEWNKFWRWHQLNHWKWQRMEQVFCQFVWLDLSVYMHFVSIHTSTCRERKKSVCLGLFAILSVKNQSSGILLCYLLKMFSYHNKLLNNIHSNSTFSTSVYLNSDDSDYHSYFKKVSSLSYIYLNFVSLFYSGI